MKNRIETIGFRVNQSSIVAGIQAKYASRNGTAANIAAKADGK